MARLTHTQAAKMRMVLIGSCYAFLAAIAGWTLNARKGDSRPVISAIHADSPDRSRTSGLLVTLLLQPEDCDRQTAKLRMWNEVAKQGRATVRGVVLSNEPNSAAAVAMNINAAFPIVSQPAPRAAAAMRTLGYTSTPIVVVSDASKRVRLIAAFNHILSVEHAERLLKDLAPPFLGDTISGTSS